MSKATSAASLVTVFSFTLSCFLSPAQASALSSSSVKPSMHHIRFSDQAVNPADAWAVTPLDPTDTLFAMRQQARRELAEAVAVPDAMRYGTTKRLEIKGQPPILEEAQLEELLEGVQDLTVEGFESIPMGPHFRAATENPDEAFNAIPSKDNFMLEGALGAAVLLLKTGFRGSAKGLNLKNKAEENERIALKEGPDKLAEFHMAEKMFRAGVAGRVMANENKGEIKGSATEGSVIGNPTGPEYNMVADVLENTGDFVDQLGPGSSSIFARSLHPKGNVGGKFPDTGLRALMVAGNIDYSLVDEVIREANELRDPSEPEIITVQQLLDPKLDPGILISRFAKLNGVSENDIDVTVLPNGDGDGGLYEAKILERLKSRDFPYMEYSVIGAGTVKPMVGAMLGAIDSKNPNRRKLFLGRSGMAEFKKGQLLAKAMKKRGGFLHAVLGTEAMKKDRLAGLANIYDARYALKKARPHDWKEITQRKKIFSGDDVVDEVIGGYVFVTDHSEDLGWPMHVEGPAQKGSLDYEVVAIEFMDDHIRMGKRTLHSQKPLPGFDGQMKAPAVHVGSSRKLKLLTHYLGLARIASLFNDGYEPAIPKENLMIPGPNYLDQRRVLDPSLIDYVNGQRELFGLDPLPFSPVQEAAALITQRMKAMYNRPGATLAGTGRLSKLPYDQAEEHDWSTIIKNLLYMDPNKLVELAIRGGANSVALGYGHARMVSPDLFKAIGLIYKANHSQLLSFPNEPHQRTYGANKAKHIVNLAQELGATAIGLTVFFGMKEEMYAEELAMASEITYWAHQAGFPVIWWTYLRNSLFKKDGIDYHLAADLCAQAVHLGMAGGADMIKQKLPKLTGGYKALGFGQPDKGLYPKTMVTNHPIDLARLLVAATGGGRIPVINSGDASGDDDAADVVYTALVNMMAGAHGLISGRKAFQALMMLGIDVLGLVQSSLLLGTPTSVLSNNQQNFLDRFGVDGKIHEYYHAKIARVVGVAA